MKLDLAKHILDIDGIAVGAPIGRLHDAAASAGDERVTPPGTEGPYGGNREEEHARTTRCR